MKMKLPIADCQLPVDGGGAVRLSIENRRSKIENGFSLVEVLVVVSILSLIVLALMAVFSATQRAFRAAVTQTDVLEGSRAAVDLIASDLRGLTPSDGVSNGAVNFFVLANSSPVYTPNNSLAQDYNPLTQSLPGSSVARTNLLNYFFVLGRQNTKWTSVGYVVNNASASPLYPLYRFYAETNISSSPATLFNLFLNEVYYEQFTNNNMSHLIDGVVQLTVRAYDPNGKWINNNSFQPYTNALNTSFFYPSSGIGNGYGEAQIYMFSNTVPASVELDLGVLEDAVLARAESLSANYSAQTNYLAGQSGAVHLFRQRVTIPNVDPTAYQ